MILALASACSGGRLQTTDADASSDAGDDADADASFDADVDADASFDTDVDAVDADASSDASDDTDDATDAAPPVVLAMAYNIRYGTASDDENSWSYRSELALDVIADHTPDVVGMQEVLSFQRDAFADRFPSYTAFGVGRDAEGGGEQCTIFYRADRLIVLEGGTFWLSEHPDEPGSVGWDAALSRICTWARFETDAGVTFYFFNTHFDHRGSQARLESARLILERIAAREHSDPVVLSGDLNSGEGSEPIELLAESMTDTYEALHPGDENDGTFHDFTGDTDGSRIDYIFVTTDIDITAAEVVRDNTDGRYPSDHFPIKATLTLP